MLIKFFDVGNLQFPTPGKIMDKIRVFGTFSLVSYPCYYIYFFFTNKSKTNYSSLPRVTDSIVNNRSNYLLPAVVSMLSDWLYQ